MKDLADDKFSVGKMMIFVFDREENIEGTGENAGFLFYGHDNYGLFGKWLMHLPKKKKKRILQPCQLEVSTLADVV